MKLGPDCPGLSHAMLLLLMAMLGYGGERKPRAYGCHQIFLDMVLFQGSYKEFGAYSALTEDFTGARRRHGVQRELSHPTTPSVQAAFADLSSFRNPGGLYCLQDGLFALSCRAFNRLFRPYRARGRPF